MVGGFGEGQIHLGPLEAEYIFSIDVEKMYYFVYKVLM